MMLFILREYRPCLVSWGGIVHVHAIPGGFIALCYPCEQSTWDVDLGRVVAGDTGHVSQQYH